jgi:hypothetical protein
MPSAIAPSVVLWWFLFFVWQRPVCVCVDPEPLLLLAVWSVPRRVSGQQAPAYAGHRVD